MLSGEALGSWLGRCLALGGEVLGARWEVLGAWWGAIFSMFMSRLVLLVPSLGVSHSLARAFLTKCLKSFLILPLNSFQHPQPLGQS